MMASVVADTPAADRSSGPGTGTERGYTILVVDDEKGIADLLCTAVKVKYGAVSASSAEEAFALMEETDFDVVVTDLRLPGRDGIAVLECAKRQDPHTEVIIITGYASLDTATSAINKGASSYLIKPVSIPNFVNHVDKAVANRDFYLRTQMLMKHAESLGAPAREHISQMAGLYSFSRRLMATIEVPQIVRILLEELNDKMGATFCAMGVSAFGSTEFYGMPKVGQLGEARFRRRLIDSWSSTFAVLNQDDLTRQKASLTLFDGKAGEGGEPADLHCVATPMIIMGKNIGAVAVYRPRDRKFTTPENQYLYVLSSIVAPLVEHGYMHRRARQLAETDPLTGVANHRSFQEILSREFSRADRQKSCLSLLILDIDDFKKVNDTFGHLIGDAVLKDLTGRILKVIRLGDVLARYGGEEFAVILPDTDIRGARIQAERVRQEICSRPYVFPNNEIPYTISLGIAMYSGETPRSKESLIRDADDALYISKHEGKNRITER